VNRPEQHTDDLPRTAVVGDLLLLADLHGSPLERRSLTALWARCYDGLLQLPPCSGQLRADLSAFCACLTEIPTCFDSASATLLARDFEQLYAGPSARERSRYFASRPLYDRSEVQALCRWGRGRGLAVDTWSEREIDPLTMLLRMLAYRLAGDGGAIQRAELRELLDREVRECLEPFVDLIAARAATRFYRDLSAVTASYLGDLRLQVEMPGATQPVPAVLFPVPVGRRPSPSIR
jgi:TorA maturation chaperone TorD